jgi:hypothetical protein
MAETVPVVGAGFLDALYAYAADANEAAQVASQVGLQVLKEGIQREASHQERWADLADEVQVFSQDGRLVVGIPGGQFASEAQTREYGDAEHPPAPLFRMSQNLQDEARAAANKYMNDVLGRVVL